MRYNVIKFNGVDTMTLKEAYESWYVKSGFGRFYTKATKKLVDVYDYFVDKKYCGHYIGQYVPSIDRVIKQSTGSESTRYFALKSIFDGENFSENDKFIDIGCGKGRVLAYMEKIKFPGKIYGIEHNPVVAEECKNWAKKYENITVLQGDAFKLNCNDYTVYYFNRPFLTEMFQNFVNKMEAEITHPIKVYYYVDQQSGGYLKNRPGWTKKKSGIAFKKGLLCYNWYPQRYSTWEYVPQQN